MPHVAVEALRPGDRIVLPSGHRVTVEAVRTHEDGLLQVRWWRFAANGEPGFKHPDRPTADGRYLGSLIAVPAGHLWRVE